MTPPDNLFNNLPGVVKALIAPFRYQVENVLAAAWQNGYLQAQRDEHKYWEYETPAGNVTGGD